MCSIDKQIKRVAIILVLALSFFVGPLKAEGLRLAELRAAAIKGDEQSERKLQLWNNCNPMHLQVVVNIGALNSDKTLTNAGIHQMLSDRLDPKGFPVLVDEGRHLAG